MVKKIKIVHIIKTLNLGGAEMNLFNLIQAFDQSRFEMHVAYSGRGELEDKFVGIGVKLFRFDMRPRKLLSFASLWIIWRLVGYIIREKIQIVHTHTFNAHLWGWAAAKLTARPIVEHVHDSRYRDPREFKLRGETSKQYTYIKYFRNLSTRVVVLTRQNYEFIVRHRINKPQNVRDIPNGIALDAIVRFSDQEKNAVRQELKLLPGMKVVLIPTRFAPEKNTELLLKIIPRVISKIPHCVFIVAGDGPLLTNFKKDVQRSDFEQAVRTPGFYPDVGKLLSITDVFLLPSKLELHSIAILEALSRGVPVIVSCGVGCNNEFIRDGENGVLRDPFTDTGWAEAIINLLDDAQLRERIGEQGRITCRQQFDIKDVARKFEELYAELL